MSGVFDREDLVELIRREAGFDRNSLALRARRDDLFFSAAAATRLDRFNDDVDEDTDEVGSDTAAKACPSSMSKCWGRVKRQLENNIYVLG